MSVLFVALFVVAAFVAGMLVHPGAIAEAIRAVRGSPSPVRAELPPRGAFLDDAHGWNVVEPSGAVRVGAGPVLLALLGAPDAVTLPERGASLAPGRPVATLRRGRRSLDLMAALEGEILEVNPALARDPGALGRDPYGEGWIVRVAPRSLGASVRRMRVAEEASAWLQERLAEVREAVVRLSPAGAVGAVGASLPDGGLPVDGLSEHLDDATWERLVASVLRRDQ